jgi:hypothetical protein
VCRSDARGVLQASNQRKVFPAIGLVHFPFLAAFISAYNAGLMPFFVHFLISDSLRLVMSKLLALHPLLEPEWLGASSSAGLEYCSKARDWLDPERLERCDARSKETFLSIIRRSGTLIASLGLRCVIFRKSDLGECDSESLEFTSANCGLIDCCELTLALEERYVDVKEYASEGTGVETGSSSRVKK